MCGVFKQWSGYACSMPSGGHGILFEVGALPPPPRPTFLALLALKVSPKYGGGEPSPDPSLNFPIDKK